MNSLLPFAIILSTTLFSRVVLVTGCGGTITITTEPVTIQSPNFPIGDGKSHYCVWRFEGPANRKLRIEFSILDVSPQLPGLRVKATKYLFV